MKELNGHSNMVKLAVDADSDSKFPGTFLVFALSVTSSSDDHPFDDPRHFLMVAIMILIVPRQWQQRYGASHCKLVTVLLNSLKKHFFIAFLAVRPDVWTWAMVLQFYTVLSRSSYCREAH